MRKFNFRIKNDLLKRFVVFLLTGVIFSAGLTAKVEAEGGFYSTNFTWDKVEEPLNEWPLDANLTNKTREGIGTAGFSYNRFYWNDHGRIVLEIDLGMFPDALNNETSGYRTFREQWDKAVLFIDPSLVTNVDVGESFFMMSYPLDSKKEFLNSAEITGVENNIFKLSVNNLYPTMPGASDYMKSKLYLVLKEGVTRDQLDEDYALELRYTNSQGSVYEQRGSQGAQVLGNYNEYPSVPNATVYDAGINNDDVTLKTIAPFQTASMPNTIPNVVFPPDMMRTVGQAVIYDNIRGKLHVYYKQAPNHYIRGSYADNGSFLSSKIGIRQVMDARIYDALKPDADGVVGQMMMLDMNGGSWPANIPTDIKKNEFSYSQTINDVGIRSYMMVPQGFKTDVTEKAIAPTGVNLKNVYLHGHRKEADYVRFIYDVDKNKMDALFKNANSSTFSISTSYISDRPTETTQTEYRLKAGQEGIIIPEGAKVAFDVPKSSRSVFKAGLGNNYERIIGNMETKRPVSEMNHYGVNPSDFGKAYTITPYIATDGGYVLTAETGLTVQAEDSISLTMFDSSSPETVKMTVIVGTTRTDYILTKYKTNEDKLYTMPNANVRSGIIINRSANTPHVNEFFTDSINITGHSKYANALVSAREAKAVATEEEVFQEAYSSTDIKSFKAEGETLNLEGYPFTLDIPSGIQLKKDMDLRFSNAAQGYFRSAPSTYRTQAKVIFDKNGGEGEPVERIVPLNEKAYGEEGYTANGFEGENILWLDADGNKVPSTADEKYLSDYEGKPIKLASSDAYISRQFYSEELNREGYTLLGWSTKKVESMSKADFENMPALDDVSEWSEENNYRFTANSPVDQNQTVYAVWEKNVDTYRIVFHDNNDENDITYTLDLPLASITNGNTGELTAYLKKEGNALFDAGFVKEGAYFVGWSEGKTVSSGTKVHQLYTNASKVRIHEEKFQLQLNEEPVEPVTHLNPWKNFETEIVNNNGIATVNLYAQYKPLVKMKAKKAWYDKGAKEAYEKHIADPENNPAPQPSVNPHFANSNVAMVLIRTTEGKTLDPTKYEIVEGFYSVGVDGEDWQWEAQEGHDVNGRKYSYLMTEFNALNSEYTEESIINHFNKHKTWASMYITMIGQSDNLSKYTAINLLDGEEIKSYMAVATSNQPEAVSEQYVNSTVDYNFELKNFQVDVLPAIIHRIQTNHNQVVIDRPIDDARYLYFRLSETAEPVVFYKDDDGEWVVHPEQPETDIDIADNKEEGKLIISSSTAEPLSFEHRAGQRVYALFTNERQDQDISKYASREIKAYDPLPLLENIKQESHIKDENGQITHNVISARIPAGSYADAEYTLGYMDGENFVEVIGADDDPITIKPDTTEKLTFNVPTGKLDETTKYIIRGIDPLGIYKDRDFDGPDIDLTAPSIDAYDLEIETGDAISDAAGKVTVDDPAATLSYKVTKGGEEVALPEGIIFDSVTRKFSGKTADKLPAEVLGEYIITFMAEDIYGNVSTKKISLTINQKQTTNPITSITQSENDQNGNAVLTIQGKQNAVIKLYSEKDGSFTEVEIPEVSGSKITNEDGTIEVTISQADVSRFNGGKIYVTQKMSTELESDKVDFTEETIKRAENKKIATGGAIVIDNKSPTPIQMLQPIEGSSNMKIINVSANEHATDVRDIDRVDLQVGEDLSCTILRQYDETGEPTGIWKCTTREFTETEEKVTVIVDPNTGETEERTVGVLNYVLPFGKQFDPHQIIKAIYYDYLGNASIPVTTTVRKLPEPIAPYDMTAINNSKAHPEKTVINGKADPGAEVSVKIGTETYTANVDELGKFTLEIPKQPQGKEIDVTSKLNNYTATGTVVVRDIQAGEYTPTVKTLTIEENDTYDLTESVSVENYAEDPNYPGKPKFEDVTPSGDIDVSTPGTYTGKVKVSYPDGSSEVVDVTVVVQAKVKDDVIDVTDDPTQEIPEGYVRVTVSTGEGTEFADGQEKKFYNVKQGSSLTESDYPVVEVTDGYEEPVTWSIPS
ncbi:MAG TPA: hypothetical protein GX736_02780, partial [Mogibacterium sp.]|nr:hypothetical protein [Mogibacterium sp.]